MDNLSKSCGNSYEPMDIDLSAHSNNAMDISFNTSDEIDTYLEADSPRVQAEPEDIVLPVISPTTNTQQATNIKTFHINMHKETKSHNTTKIKIICSVIVLCLSVITYQILNVQCSNDVNPAELKMSLSDKLYGQFRAIDSLIEALSLRERSKILFFYGGTGVGKTFAASLILDHVGYYSNVYHYTMPSFMETFTTDFMMGLTVCKHTIFIVDDLTAKDMNVKTYISDLITKSQNLDKEITVILIFNCDNAAKDFERQCDESFPTKLLHNFKSIDAFKKLIKFELLKEEHLKRCIETELANKKLSNIEFERLMKTFNVSLDGCKGVHTKMKLLGIS